MRGGIRVNIEFEKTEQKKYQLLYRLPAIKLRPTPRTTREYLINPQQPDGLKKAVSVFREYLTYLIGPKHAKLKATLDEVIFDMVCPAGIGFVKVGYQRFTDGTIPIDTGEMQPDPTYQAAPGTILGLRPVPMVPVMGEAPNIIADKYYASRISPARGLVPAEFMGSDFNQADWLGYDGWILRDGAIGLGWPIPEDLKESASVSDDRIVELDKKGQKAGQLHFREVFYYASRVNTTVKHPDKIRRLVFVDGITEPIIHEDYKDQEFDDRGRFVKGLRTLPIKVGTLRYVSDTAMPPSDCSVMRRPIDELAALRTLQMLHRKKAGPLRWVDGNALIDEAMKEKVIRQEYYDTIVTDGPGDRLAGEVGKASYPAANDNYEDRVMGDINRGFALGANQSSVKEQGGTTATEIASIAQSTANRLSGEREKIVGGLFVEIVEAFGCLAQLYADEATYVEVLGPTGEKLIEPFTKDTVPGEYLYEVVPNSALAPDASADRDLALNRYNLLANDPYANREQLYRDTVEAYDGDPDRLTKIPDPKPPEKPSVSMAFKGEDLNPAAPQYPNVVNLLKAAGIPDILPPAQPDLTGAEPMIRPANVVDRERMRMAAADNADQRAGGLTGVGIGGR